MKRTRPAWRTDDKRGGRAVSARRAPTRLQRKLRVFDETVTLIAPMQVPPPVGSLITHIWPWLVHLSLTVTQPPGSSPIFLTLSQLLHLETGGGVCRSVERLLEARKMRNDWAFQ